MLGEHFTVSGTKHAVKIDRDREEETLTLVGLA